MSREAAEFYASMQEEYELLSGCVPDPASDFSLRFHTLAAELAALDAQAEALERQCFPLTATGQALDAHAAGRGLTRRPAAQAVGILTFTRQEGASVELPAGLVCTTEDGELYETTQAATFSGEEDALAVPARAKQAGRRGNAAARLVCVVKNPPAGLLKVENLAPFSGGADREGDESLRERLRQALAEPSNGANPAWYRQQAENWPGVQSALVLNQAGTVALFLAGEGASPLPQELCQQVKAALSQPRELCLTVEVSPAPVTQVAVSAAVEPGPGLTLEQVQAPLAQAVETLMSGLSIGQTLPVAQLVQCLMGTGLIADCRVDSPVSSQTPASNGVVRAGAVSVTLLGEETP